MNAQRKRHRGLTLIELLVVVCIIAILAAIGAAQYQRAKIRADVAVSKNNLRVLSEAMELYKTDNGAYPSPAISLPDDPFGVVAESALRALTTPVAYVSSASAYRDPFGAIQVQGTLSGGAGSGMPNGAFNLGKSILFFGYPQISAIIQEPLMGRDGYALVSLGPDTKDSFIIFYPFPQRGLPPRAQVFGINELSDTIYDPTNGAISRGDIAAFGGNLSVPRLVGGGNP